MKSKKARAVVFGIIALIVALAFIPVLGGSGSNDPERIESASASLPDIMAADTSSGLSYALSSTVNSVRSSLSKPNSTYQLDSVPADGLIGDAALELLNEAQEEEPEPTQTPEAQPGTIPSVDSDKPYMIVIYIGSQRGVVYSKDAAGAYTVPVKVFTVSTGLGNNTVRGTYRIAYKWRWLPMHNNTIYCQYVSQWNGNYLFHSIMYSYPDPSCLDRSAYARLGSKASAGCVRMTVRDAKWIYDNCESGTVVISTTDAVPNGTPGSAGVPALTLNVGWDPTDPDERNPYRQQGTPTPEVTPSATPAPTPTPIPVPTPTPAATETHAPEPDPTETPQESETPASEPSSDPNAESETPVTP